MNKINLHFPIRITLFIVLLKTVNLTYGQDISNPIESFNEEKEIIYGIDNRRTHIRKDNTVIYGVYTGIGFGEKLRLKIGFNAAPFERGIHKDERELTKKNRFFFASLGQEYDFFQYKKFGITAYLQAGLGKNYYREFSAKGDLVNEGSNIIIPMETGLHFGYYINSYLRLKSGIGWRFVKPDASADLSGYYFKVGLGFNLRKYQELHSLPILEFIE